MKTYVASELVVVVEYDGTDKSVSELVSLRSDFTVVSRGADNVTIGNGADSRVVKAGQFAFVPFESGSLRVVDKNYIDSFFSEAHWVIGCVNMSIHEKLIISGLSEKTVDRLVFNKALVHIEGLSEKTIVEVSDAVRSKNGW